MKLLIVDDDEAYAAQLARSLGRRGHACRIAHDGEAALALAEGNLPEGVLLDLRLGESSGLRYIAALRALSADMVIVLLTGYASVATAVEAIKRGADDYLPKPSSVAAIERALGGEAGEDEGPEPPEQMTPLRRLEWEHIQQALATTDGNVSAAARLLGMHRRSLQRKLGKRPVSEGGQS